MKYLDKNGNAHNSAAGMRLADIRSTNIVEAVKEVTGMICDIFDGLIHKQPKNEHGMNNPAEDLMFEKDYGCNLEEIENINSEKPQNLPEVCISKEAPKKGTITNIWYNIDMGEWQFEEAGNPSIVIKTRDEMTPEFSNMVYNRADDSLRRGEKLLVNLMFSVCNENLPKLAEWSHIYIDLSPSFVGIDPLRSLIGIRANISLRIVGEVHPSQFGKIPGGVWIGQIMTDSIVALTTASRTIRRET